METFNGKSVFNGIAIGTLEFWDDQRKEIRQYFVSDTETEYTRFLNSLENAILQLENAKEKASSEVGKDNADIFEIHKLMLQDEEYIGCIKNKILTDHFNAEYAVSSVCNDFYNRFSSMSDKYMQARAVDIKDISERLLNILNKKDNNKISYNEPIILVAEELTPSQTLQLEKSKILAFITAKGSINSHTSILARAMNIPAIIGLDIFSNKSYEGKLAVVDGYSGNVYIDPSEELLANSRNKLITEKETINSLSCLVSKESISRDGKKINLYANIGNIHDLQTALENDAEGIGLFRSEFIFLESKTLPSEEEQYLIYKNAVEKLNGKKIIIRTLDIGADKKSDCFNIEPEDNPALGLRAIRLCFKRPEIFKTQIRALLRASIFGNLAIMYPMIISLKEILAAKEILFQCAEELKHEGIPYKIPEQGIMIETPAAVMISDDLAKEVSFFSIGTNDLSQYILAIDRQNHNLDEFFDPYHPAILKMIETTVNNAHKNKIWVGVCGELATDLNMTATLLKLGVDELSVSPSNVLSIRKKILETDVENKN